VRNLSRDLAAAPALRWCLRHVCDDALKLAL